MYASDMSQGNIFVERERERDRETERERWTGGGRELSRKRES